MVKNLPDNAGDVRDMGLIPRLERSPGVGNGNPPQYFCLENPMDRGAWWATVQGVAKSCTRLTPYRVEGSMLHTLSLSKPAEVVFSLGGVQLSILKHRLRTEMVLGLTSLLSLISYMPGQIN